MGAVNKCTSCVETKSDTGESERTGAADSCLGQGGSFLEHRIREATKKKKTKRSRAAIPLRTIDMGQSISEGYLVCWMRARPRGLRGNTMQARVHVSRHRCITSKKNCHDASTAVRRWRRDMSRRGGSQSQAWLQASSSYRTSDTLRMHVTSDIGWTMDVQHAARAEAV